MSVSFVINSTGKPKTLGEMNGSEIKKLSNLLSGSIDNLNKSEVRVIKNSGKPIKLSCLSVGDLAVIQSSVNNYKSGHINEVCCHYTDEETSLILALTKHNMNVSKAARELHVTRDKVRDDIKRFKRKWGIDLNSYSGLSRAYVFSLGS